MGAVEAGRVLTVPSAHVAPNFGREVHCLLGLPFDAVSLDQATELVARAAARRTPCFLSTPNLNFLIAAQSDPAFRDSVINSELSVADGMPLVWIARLLGIPLPQRVSGSDLFERLRSRRGDPIRVYFFGGPDGVARRAHEALNAAGGGMRSVGFDSPGFGSMEDLSGEERIACINASGADFVVVSLGAKKGQAWIERNRARIDAPVISHLGAVVNFVAGSVSRAPVWMQRAGLEWLWRVKEEPALWKRYYMDGRNSVWLMLTRVVPLAWHVWRTRWVGERVADGFIESRMVRSSVRLVLRGSFTRDSLHELRTELARTANPDKDLILDLSSVGHVDSAFAGLMMLLYGYQTRHGRQLVLSGLQPQVRRFMNWLGAGFLVTERGDPVVRSSSGSAH